MRVHDPEALDCTSMYTRIPPLDAARAPPGNALRTISSSASAIIGTTFEYSSNVSDESESARRANSRLPALRRAFAGEQM